jgi:hypothetical protein
VIINDNADVIRNALDSFAVVALGVSPLPWTLQPHIPSTPTPTFATMRVRLGSRAACLTNQPLSSLEISNCIATIARHIPRAASHWVLYFDIRCCRQRKRGHVSDGAALRLSFDRLILTTELPAGNVVCLGTVD